MTENLNRKPNYGRLCPPVSAYEWARALSDPESVVGKDFWRMIVETIIEEDDEEALEEELIFAHILRKKRADQELRLKVEYKKELETARLLDAYNAEKKEEYVALNLPTPSILIDYYGMSLRAMQYGEYLGQLLKIQTDLHANWEAVHRKNAKNMLKYIKHSKLALIGVAGEEIILTPEKIVQLEDALTPVPFAVFCELHPELCEQFAKSAHTQPNIAAENMVKAMNVLMRTTALSLLHNRPDSNHRLTDDDLLEVAKNNPLAFNMNKMGLFQDEMKKMMIIDASVSYALQQTRLEMDLQKSNMLSDLHTLYKDPFSLQLHHSLTSHPV